MIVHYSDISQWQNQIHFLANALIKSRRTTQNNGNKAEQKRANSSSSLLTPFVSIECVWHKSLFTIELLLWSKSSIVTDKYENILGGFNKYKTKNDNKKIFSSFVSELFENNAHCRFHVCFFFFWCMFLRNESMQFAVAIHQKQCLHTATYNIAMQQINTIRVSNNKYFWMANTKIPQTLNSHHHLTHSHILSLKMGFAGQKFSVILFMAFNFQLKRCIFHFVCFVENAIFQLKRLQSNNL